MRKEDVASYIVYIVMVVIAIVIGFTVLKDLVSDLGSNVPTGSALLFSICMVLSAIIFNALIIELGHLIGAKIGGYRVTFFSVLWFTIFEKQGKKHFGFKNYDGLTGEVKIVPKKDKANPKAFVWFPILLYIVELIAVIIIFSSVTKMGDKSGDLQWLVVTSFIFACVGGLIVLYDYVPFRLDSMTDGYRLTLLSKKVNIEAFNKKLEIENAEMQGLEIPEIPVYEDITDYTASINLLKVYRLLDEEKYQEAEELLNLIIKDPKLINAETNNICVSLLVYIHLMSEEIIEATHYYANIPSTVRKYISSEISMDAIKSYMLVSGIIEESASEVKYAISKEPKALKYTPNGRIQIEMRLFERALNRIKELKPDLLKENKED